jgi:hypothetical protein
VSHNEFHHVIHNGLSELLLTHLAVLPLREVRLLFGWVDFVEVFEARGEGGPDLDSHIDEFMYFSLEVEFPLHC